MYIVLLNKVETFLILNKHALKSAKFHCAQPNTIMCKLWPEDHSWISVSTNLIKLKYKRSVIWSNLIWTWCCCQLIWQHSTFSKLHASQFKTGNVEAQIGVDRWRYFWSGRDHHYITNPLDQNSRLLSSSSQIELA